MIAETIWLSPEVAANDNQPLGGDDGAGGYAPLAVVTGSGASTALYWVHGNHLGVPIVTTDASGAVASPTGFTMVGFPGQTRTLADLYYNRYRDYDSSTGRYIQADPIGLEGGSNAFAYAEGNPVTKIDPDGLRPVGPERCRQMLLAAGIKETSKCDFHQKFVGAALISIPIIEEALVSVPIIVKKLSKDCYFDGPSVRDGRVFGIRYKKKILVVRVDYAAYPGTNGEPRLHIHPPWAPKSHIPIDPRRIFD